MNIPSPILIFGDQYLSKNNINSLKNKYGEYYRWVPISVTDNSIEALRSEAGIEDFLAQPKLIVIHSLPNQKAVREAIIELCSSSTDTVKFVVWDSTNTIRLDPKTKLPNKTWDDFIEKFKTIPNSKIVNNGAELTEKDDGDCISLVQNYFSKYKKTITEESAKIFVIIVGRDRGLLISEIEKLALNSPEKISTEFILENAFPTSKEAVLYKFGNVLDEGYTKAISTLDTFLEAGINANVLAEIMAKKVRWQMAACHMYSKGISWYDIDKKLMDMGKFPSCLWYNDKIPYSQKQKIAQGIETPEGLQQFKAKEIGLPEYYFTAVKKKKTKYKKGEEPEESEKPEAKESVILGKKEVLPMPFLATQITNSLQSNFVKPNLGKMSPDEIKVKLLDRSIRVYLEVIENLKEIRYGEDPVANLYEMVRTITDRTLI